MKTKDMYNVDGAFEIKMHAQTQNRKKCWKML